MMNISIKDFHRTSLKFKRKDSISNNQIHWFSYRISPYLSYVLIKLRVSADLATIFFLISGVMSAFTVSNPITSYLLWRFHILLDMSDGDIARFNKSFSKRGKYWDRLNHSIINPLYCLMISLKYFMLFDDKNILLVGLLLTFTQNLAMNAKYYYPESFDSSSIRYSSNKLKSRVKNILLDLLGMEGIIMFFVVGSFLHNFATVIAGLIFFSSITIVIAFIKIYKRSYLND